MRFFSFTEYISSYRQTYEIPFLYYRLRECTIAGGCTSRPAKVTLDANWRWIHQNGQNCYKGNAWEGVCANGGDPAACAQQCALEAVSSNSYQNTYGIQQLSDGIQLNFVTEHQHGKNVGSRLYVMNPDDDEKYMMFQLKNREFAMDVDVSNLFCGMNGAVYFVEMDEMGGKGLNNNNAGAKYGTGYCDAQCPHDIKFIDGEANTIDWAPNPDDQDNNMGKGKYGSCCAEMDIWEANSMATAYTPHPCDLGGNSGKAAQFRCEGTDCGDNDKGERYDGVCDKDGCDINPYRMGNPDFYGRGSQYAVNTLEKMTLVTQFITDNGTDSGNLVEIRRFYVQNGQVIHSPESTILGPNDTDSITDEFCVAKKTLFGDIDDYQEKGGTVAMGDSLDRGQVLALSLWDDVEVNMLWLDAAFPLDKPVSDPGVKRGDCPGGEQSTPTWLRNNHPDGYVRFHNVAIGEIGSTVPGLATPAPVTPAPVPAPTTPAPVPTPTTPAPVPTPPPTPGPACWSNDWKKCNHPSVLNSCNALWLPDGEQGNCVALWGDCTGQQDSCCGPAVCIGDGSFSQCSEPPPTAAPTPEPTPSPTKSPTPEPTSQCKDEESFMYRGTIRDCDWASKIICGRKTKANPSDPNEQVQDKCKETCDYGCSNGCTDISPFNYKNTQKTCEWAGTAWCDIKTKNEQDTKLRDHCPLSCNACPV